MGVTRMEGSKITSKTSSLKALLLRAWRERWSDLQWGVHIKTILPRGVSGDVYNLADCILQQALVGSAPNLLVLSYLKHSLSSQLVSYAAVLQRIAKYDGFHKPHCVSCLLEFVESIQSGITCRGKPEEGILAGAVLSLVHWLVQCYQHASTGSACGDPAMAPLLEKPPIILQNILGCSFLTAMLTLARYDESDLYDEVVRRSGEVIATEESAMDTSETPQVDTSPSLELMTSCLRKVCGLEVGGAVEEAEPLTYIMQPLLAVLVMLNPCIDTNQLANQILLIAKLKNYSKGRALFEVIRASLVCLEDTPTEESKWGAFTFIKLPRVIAEVGGPADMDVAMAELAHYAPLVERVDSATSGRSLEALLAELARCRLLSDSALSSRPPPPPDPPSPAQPNPISMVIIRAQSTLQRVLKTLDADYKEALTGVLCQVLTGKSLELMLAVAAVEGKLQTFASHLLRFNEYSKAGGTARPVLFDITFLMLTYIVQVYGSHVVFPRGESEDSFFLHWSSQCLAERNKPKCPQTFHSLADATAVDTILTLLNSPQPPDFSQSGLSWETVCLSMGGVMKEVLSAWELGTISATDVKRILDNLKHNMCSLPICAAAYLVTSMLILPQDGLLKPMNMIQQLLSAGGGGGSGAGASEGEGSPQREGTPPPPPDIYRERAALMAQIIRRLQHSHTPKPSHSGLGKEGLHEELVRVWAAALHNGSLSMQAVKQLEALYLTAGPDWLLTNLIAEVVKVRYRQEMDKAVDLAVAVLHVDIEATTLHLLDHLIPSYLHDTNLSSVLVEPVSECVARLCVYCVYSALEGEGSTSGGGRKRPAPPPSHDDILLVGGKVCRLETGAALLTSEPPYLPPHRVAASLATLLRTFTSLVEFATFLSPTIHFIFTFLRLLALNHSPHPHINIPSSLVRGLVRLVPELLTEDLLLRLYDVMSTSGRRSASSDLCLLRNIQLKPPH